MKYTWEFAGMVKGTESERNKEKRARQRGLVRFLRKCINASVDGDEYGFHGFHHDKPTSIALPADRFTPATSPKYLAACWMTCRSRVLRAKHLVVMIRLFASLHRYPRENVCLSESVTCRGYLSFRFERLGETSSRPNLTD